MNQNKSQRDTVSEFISKTTSSTEHEVMPYYFNKAATVLDPRKWYFSKDSKSTKPSQYCRE